MTNSSKPEAQRELDFLTAMDEDAIDTSDVGETIFSGRTLRGAYFNDFIQHAGYDVRGIANWFIKKSTDTGQALTNMSLNKLVFFAYERAIFELNSILTPALAEAWDHGPVFREIFHEAKGSGAEEIKTPIKSFNMRSRKMEIAECSFDSSTLDLLNETWNELGNSTSSQLRNISHREGGAWHRVWNHISDANPGMRIDPRTIALSEPTYKKYGK